jgi:hypothetical protein
MDLLWLPVERSWRLNERHYGALQGLNKAETAAKFGDDQVKVWRRSYDIPPPPLDPGDERFPGRDPRYKDVSPSDLPLTECLKDTVARFLPYWHERIGPAIKSGKRVIVAAHGNSLRALVKYLDDISDKGHRRAEHPHRHPAGLRAGRQPAAAQALLSGRSGGGRGRHQGRRRPGDREEVAPAPVFSAPRFRPMSVRNALRGPDALPARGVREPDAPRGPARLDHRRV